MKTPTSDDKAHNRPTWSQVIGEHQECIAALEKIGPAVEKAVAVMSQALLQGAKLLLCGNGGSAADCQHFAAEVVGRFAHNRPGWPALALTTDTSILTAVGNDFGYDTVFSRQVEAMAGPGDVLVGISTSGKSRNVIKAFQAAAQKGVTVIALTAAGANPMTEMADLDVCVPQGPTARIQEAHILILHYWAARLEQKMMGRGCKGAS